MSVEICHVSKHLALMMIEVTKVQEIMKVISFSLEFINLANNRGLLHFKLCTRKWSQLCPQKEQLGILKWEYACKPFQGKTGWWLSLCLQILW